MTQDVSPDVPSDVSPEGGIGVPPHLPGTYRVLISDPKHPEREVSSVPGALWDMGIPIVSGKRLHVHLKVPDGTCPEDCGVAFVQATYTTEDGLAVRNLQVPTPNGRVRFDGIPAHRATVEALDDAENRLAVTFAELRDADTSIDVSLSAPSLKLRIVDAARIPVAGARVQIRKLTAVDARPLDEVSDADGFVALPGLGTEALLLHASHPDVGTRTNVTVEQRGADAGPVEVKLEAPATLRVRFFDHSQTLEGVRARILDTRTDFEVASPISDGEGRVSCERLAAGRYCLVVDDPDFWPVEQGVDATLDANFTEVQLRRLGDLDLAVRTPSARPMAHVAIDLHSVEFDADVSSWIDDGRISGLPSGPAAAPAAAAASGLSSDRSGRLLVTGLPNGSYRWRATSCHGETVEGLVTIPPRGRAEVPITIG